MRYILYFFFDFSPSARLPTAKTDLECTETTAC